MESSDRENSQEDLDGEESGDKVQAEDRGEEKKGLQDLKGRLKRLREMRAEMGEDIVLLERALIVMEGGSV